MLFGNAGGVFVFFLSVSCSVGGFGVAFVHSMHRTCKDEDPTPFKRQYLVVFVYVCFTLHLTSYCQIYAITAYLSV